MFYLLLQKIKDIYNEMAKRREKKEQTMVHKTLHRKLTITSHGGVNSRDTTGTTSDTGTVYLSSTSLYTAGF
jgi:hypothetical protein